MPYTPPTAYPTGPRLDGHAAPGGLTPKIWAIIAAVGVVVVTAAVGITLLFNDSGSPTASTTAKGAGDSGVTDPRGGASDSDSKVRSGPSRHESALPPPIVREPDTFGEVCANGFSLPGHSGWATHSGRGSAQTSCFFANSVLTAYWDQYPSPDEANRVVIAAGTVPCSSTGGECSGDRFVMRCAVSERETWITCTGGKNARVYIY